jgi:hypothetical protein
VSVDRDEKQIKISVRFSHLLTGFCTNKNQDEKGLCRDLWNSPKSSPSLPRFWIKHYSQFQPLSNAAATMVGSSKLCPKII